MFPRILVQHVFMFLDACPVLCLTLFIAFISFIFPSQTRKKKKKREIVSCNRLVPCGLQDCKQTSHRWFTDHYILYSFHSTNESHSVPLHIQEVESSQRALESAVLALHAYHATNMNLNRTCSLCHQLLRSLTRDAK